MASLLQNRSGSELLRGEKVRVTAIPRAEIGPPPFSEPSQRDGRYFQDVWFVPVPVPSTQDDIRGERTRSDRSRSEVRASSPLRPQLPHCSGGIAYLYPPFNGLPTVIIAFLIQINLSYPLKHKTARGRSCAWWLRSMTSNFKRYVVVLSREVASSLSVSLVEAAQLAGGDRHFCAQFF